MSCLENIVTLRGCSEEESLSGLDLMDAPEISPINLSKIATEKDTNGVALAERILSKAHILVRNDFLDILSRRNMIVDLSARKYITSEFKPQNQIAVDSVEKGLAVYKSNKAWRKSLRKLTINRILVYPLADAASVTIKFYDSGLRVPLTTEFDVNLIGGEVNEFDLSEFDIGNYVVEGEYVIIAMNGDGLLLGSAELPLCAGCNGSLPNDCGYTKSYKNGRLLNGREGYGLGVEFSCECDYDQLMCDFAKTSLGELVYLKARIGLLEERKNSNRLNNLIIYGKEEAKEELDKLYGEYDFKFQKFEKDALNRLQTYSGDCLICDTVRSVVSV